MLRRLCRIAIHSAAVLLPNQADLPLTEPDIPADERCCAGLLDVHLIQPVLYQRIRGCLSGSLIISGHIQLLDAWGSTGSWPSITGYAYCLKSFQPNIRWNKLLYICTCCVQHAALPASDPELCVVSGTRHTWLSELLHR